MPNLDLKNGAFTNEASSVGKPCPPHPTPPSPYLPQSTVECSNQWFARRVHKGVKCGHFLNRNNKLNSMDIMALIWKAAFPNRYFPERNIAGRKFQWLNAERKPHVEAVTENWIFLEFLGGSIFFPCLFSCLLFELRNGNLYLAEQWWQREANAADILESQVHWMLI